MTRFLCRDCGQPRVIPKRHSSGRAAEGAKATAQPAARLVPWARAQAAATQATALEAAVAAVRNVGGDDQLVKDLETKLDRAKKESTDGRPLQD